MTKGVQPTFRGCDARSMVVIRSDEEDDMGLMDKVKAVAQDAATQAKAATQQAQTKIEQSQLSKKMDDTAKQLGYQLYNERRKGTPATDVERLLDEIGELETRIAAEGQAPAAASPESTGAPAAVESTNVSTSSSEATSGDFKL